MPDLLGPKVKFLFKLALGVTQAEGWNEPMSLTEVTEESVLLGVFSSFLLSGVFRESSSWVEREFGEGDFVLSELSARGDVERMDLLVWSLEESRGDLSFLFRTLDLDLPIAGELERGIAFDSPIGGRSVVHRGTVVQLGSVGDRLERIRSSNPNFILVL